MTKIEEINRAKTLVKKGILTAPDGFLEADNDVLAKICNGCGAADSTFDFIPDSMWGLCICIICHIHDYGYHTGQTREDKDREDDRFLTNLINFIEEYSGNWFSRMARRRRALKYYEGVVAFGDDAFFKDK